MLKNYRFLFELHGDVDGSCQLIAEIATKVLAKDGYYAAKYANNFYVAADAVGLTVENPRLFHPKEDGGELVDMDWGRFPGL